jgi:hypothetical protein
MATLPFWAKFLTGVVLSPLVLWLQFYALRFLGVPFELTAYLLVFINLIAIYPIVRQASSCVLPERHKIVGFALTLLIPVAFFIPYLIATQTRVYSSHGWMHADIVYMLANGDLLLDEPQLVGVKLAYPWAGHIFQAILSFLLDSPPVSSYLLTNLLLLLCIFGFMAGLVTELGGNHFARISSIIWLSFGVNCVGSIFLLAAPAGLTRLYDIAGDYRYTPWLLKFFFFEQIPFALGMFIAMVFFVVRPWPGNLTGYPLAVVGLLLTGIGVMYPLLAPAAFAIVGAKALAEWLDRSTHQQGIPYGHLLALGLVVLSAGTVTVAHLHFLTQDRVTTALLLSPRNGHWLRTLQKMADGVLVTSPLLLGLALTFRQCWKNKRTATLVLVMGGLASGILYVVLDIPYMRNEYKFMFTAAICLAPFSSIAFDSFRRRVGYRAMPLFAIGTLVLAAPFAHKVYTDFREWGPQDSTKLPLMDVRHFDLRLDAKEEHARLYQAIRERTPVNAILVFEQAELHLPTLTRRRLYAPPEQRQPPPGVNLTSDYLLTRVKGYDKRILEDRRAVLRDLFNLDDAFQRARSLERILSLNRPVTIILDELRHAALLAWLKQERWGTSLYKERGLIAWLVQPRTVSQNASLMDLSPHVNATF